MMAPVALEVKSGTRRFWIMSQPTNGGWTARVVEVLDAAGNQTRDLDITATGQTRSIADEAAHGKLHLWLASNRKD